MFIIVSALERNRSDSMNTYLKGIYQISLHYDLVHQWLFHTGEAENPGLLSPQGWLYPPAWCWGPGGFFGELFTSKPCWQPEKAGLIWGKQCSDGRNRLGVLANRQKAKPSFCMGSAHMYGTLPSWDICSWKSLSRVASCLSLSWLQISQVDNQDYLSHENTNELGFKIGRYLKFRCFFVLYMNKIVVEIKYSNLIKAHRCGIVMDMYANEEIIRYLKELNVCCT